MGTWPRTRSPNQASICFFPPTCLWSPGKHAQGVSVGSQCPDQGNTTSRGMTGLERWGMLPPSAPVAVIITGVSPELSVLNAFS